MWCKACFVLAARLHVSFNVGIEIGFLLLYRWVGGVRRGKGWLTCMAIESLCLQKEGR